MNGVIFTAAAFPFLILYLVERRTHAANLGRMRAEALVRSRMTELSDNLHQADTPEAFAAIALDHVSRFIPLLCGALYLGQDEDYVLAGGMGQDAVDAALSVGPGFDLIRRVGAERKRMVIATGSDTPLKLSVGIGIVDPGRLLLYPAVAGELAAAVLVLAPQAPLSQDQEQLLDAFMPSIGVNALILQGHMKTHRLLEDSRRQTGLLEHQAEELVAHQVALQATEEWYHDIIESAPDGILISDRGGKIILTNARVEQLFGYARDELLGRPIEDLVPRATREGHAELRHQFVEIGQTRQIGRARGSLQGLRKDGSTFPAEIGLSPLPRSSYGEGCVCALIRDISARLQAEARLRDSRLLLQAVIDNVPAMIYMKDREGRYLFVNKTWSKITGFNQAELAGKRASDVLPDDTARRLAEADAEVLDSGEPRTSEEQFVIDGVAHDFIVVKTPIRDSDGQVYALCGINSDITVRKESERMLVAAKECAEDAARAKADFLANMSHEIRTPLNAIIGLTHLALKASTDPGLDDYLGKISQAGHHLLAIVNDILDFSKIESGKLSLESTALQLESVVTSAIQLVAEQAAEKGLELVLDLPSDVPDDLYGDALRLKQILINYLTNAVKFTERGEVSVVVRVIEDGEDQVTLRFEVRDTGIGIEPDKIARLFRGFEQGDNSITRKFGGTGLGLAISSRLAEMMGGECGVDSTPGAGSAFWFTARLDKRRNGSRRLVPHPDLRGMRVLVADDNANMRSIMEQMLGAMSFQVAAAATGMDAIETVRQAAADQPFSLVLLDWDIPGGGGDTARALKALDLPSALHVIVLTAHARTPISHQAGLAGADMVMTKPLSASAVFDAIEQLFVADAGERRDVLAQGPGDGLVPALAGRKVLLAEDNKFNQQVALELLSDMGLAVTLAADGQEAVDHVRRGQFDLVLMDVQMPTMDGITATRMIRDAGLVDLPIIAMTANAMPEDRDQCLLAGMNDYVAKPIDPEALIAALVRWSGVKGVASEAERLPRGIAGLDAADGLRRSRGNSGLYRKLLRQFAFGNDDMLGQIRAAIAAGDGKTAQRLCHSLRAAAGQIGAKRLAGQAAALEKALKSGGDGVAGFSDLTIALEGLIAALKSEVAPEAEREAISGEASQIVGQLERMIAEHDPAALDLAEAQDAMLAAALGSMSKEFFKLLRQYRFDEALQVLHAIR